MIARTWRGWTRTRDAVRYAAYVRATGIRAYGSTPGNLGAVLLMRDEGDRTEFLVISYWESLASIEAFAGSDLQQAVFYPEDDAYLVDRDWRVNHYVVDESPELEGARVSQIG